MNSVRKSPFLLFPLFWGLLLLACSGESQPSTSSKARPKGGVNAGGKSASPNVLLITIDTTRADHLGCYGHEGIQTPNMDGLAEEGVLFEEAFAVQPVTLPAHCSILTGKYPFRHGVRDNNIYELSSQNETLAEILAAKGYVTTAFVASYVLHHKFGLSQGFHFYNDRFVKPKQKGRLPVDRRASEVSFLASEWLKEMDNELATHSFFLWLHYYDPHADYSAPHPYNTAYGNPYDGEIAYLDDWLGFLFDELKKRGQWDDTMVVLVGDHGEGFGEHGENTHGLFIYRATTHVPLIMKFPRGKNAGQRVAARVSQVDIVPTILAELHLKGADVIDGRPLQPLILKKEKGHRDVYSEVFIPRTFHWSELTGVRAGNDFYVSAPNPELYDTLEDPGELKNRFGAEKIAAQSLQEKLDKMVNDAELIESESVVLSDEMAMRLEQLGYFIGSDGPVTSDREERLPDPKDRVDIFNGQQRANNLIEKGRVEEAVLKYEELVALDGNNPRFLMELANLYVNGGHFLKAEKLYQKAIGIDFKNARMHSLMGSMYQKWGKPKRAAAYFLTALEINPNDYNALFQLSVIHMKNEEFQVAKQRLKQVVALSGNAVAYNNLGYISIKVDHHFDEGIRYIKKAVKLAVNKAPFLFSLGIAYLENDRWQKAKQTLEQALKLVPDNWAYIEALEKVYRALGDERGIERLKHRHQVLLNQ